MLFITLVGYVLLAFVSFGSQVEDGELSARLLGILLRQHSRVFLVLSFVCSGPLHGLLLLHHLPRPLHLVLLEHLFCHHRPLFRERDTTSFLVPTKIEAHFQALLQVREVRQKITDVSVKEIKEKGEKFHNTKLPERVYPKFSRLDKMQTAASLRHPQMRHLKKAKDETPRNSVETLESHQLDRPEIKDIRYVKNRVPLWRVEQTINAANNRAVFQQNKLDETTYADA